MLFQAMGDPVPRKDSPFPGKSPTSDPKSALVINWKANAETRKRITNFVLEIFIVFQSLSHFQLGNRRSGRWRFRALRWWAFETIALKFNYFSSSPLPPVPIAIGSYLACASNPYRIAASSILIFISFRVLNLMQYPVTLAFPIFFPYALAKYVLSLIPRI